MAINSPKWHGASVFIIIVLLLASHGAGKDSRIGGDGIPNAVRAAPDLQRRVHKSGNVRLMITNYGEFGNEANTSYIDPETGLPGPGCEFPAGSDLGYLFMGGLWIGAIVDGDTLVTTATDGWQWVNEMFPDDGATSNIEKRSTIPGNPDYSTDAVSEADYVAVFFDTLANPAITHTDPYDQRAHAPLGLKIIQESYSWSAPGLDNFIIVKERLQNIGQHYLDDVVIGLYFDCDVGHPATNSFFYDDITGSINIPQDATGYATIAGWIADNNGDPTSGSFDYRSPRDVFGVAIIEQPALYDVAYNWWVSWGDPQYDWGPTLVEEPIPLFTGGSGTPSGDKLKYKMMRRYSRDFDQMWAAVDQTSLGWHPPHPVASHRMDMADGFDTKFLLSTQLGDLSPGDSRDLVFVIAMGEDFHQAPNNFAQLFSAQNPTPFYQSLELHDLQETILRARLQYRLATTGLLGDSDNDEVVNISDVVYLINYIFASGPAPANLNGSDVDANCQVDMGDIVHLINFIFASGPYPQPGCIGK